MEVAEKIDNYYAQTHPFRDGIALLRNLAGRTEAKEGYKWNFPVYTIDNKNVFGICRFKNHFGIWFFNGALLNDPKQVLQNAQEGKTKAMRHWKFTEVSQVEEEAVLEYLNEAIANQKKGLVIISDTKRSNLSIPEPFQTFLQDNPELKKAFEKFSTYKQREFCEYIFEAKQDATKVKRLQKIVPMLEKGIGLNDAYKKKSTS
ncbi:MAG: YdeI/OmpD-associated family protein [Bacteroidota bacterium]